MTKCEKCGKKMNPVEAMLGPVCRDCVDKAREECIHTRPMYHGDTSSD